MKHLHISILLFLGATFSYLSCKPKASTPTIAEFSNISVEQSKKLLDANSNVIFLDVRTPQETSEGMIPGADQIDFRSDDFTEKVSVLDKSKDYIVYCRSGNRSSKASKIMVDLGFKNVRNMEGGYNDWEEQMK